MRSDWRQREITKRDRRRLVFARRAGRLAARVLMMLLEFWVGYALVAVVGHGPEWACVLGGMIATVDYKCGGTE